MVVPAACRKGKIKIPQVPAVQMDLKEAIGPQGLQ